MKIYELKAFPISAFPGGKVVLVILAVSPAGMAKFLGPEHQKQLLSELDSGGRSGVLGVKG